PKHGRPAEQGAPIEGEPKHGLRPIAESLDEWIKGDDRQHAKPEQDREAVEAREHGEADQAEHDHEDEGGFGRDLPARQRPPARMTIAPIANRMSSQGSG